MLSESLAQQPASPGMSAALDGPSLRWSGAVGVLDRASGSPLRPGDGYRIALTTKTFTAVATLGLAERGRLRLDAPIARYLRSLRLRDDRRLHHRRPERPRSPRRAGASPTPTRAYVLLGPIIESLTGRSQAAAYRTLLRFRALGLRATYFETLEPKPRDAPRRAPRTTSTAAADW